MNYFSKGRFTDDAWLGRTILSADEWRERAPDTAEPVGLRLEPGFDVETLADKLDQIGLIAIAFPKFTDGRGYSMGWLLRTRLGYKGEMRAVGDVLFDEMQFMVRCGFDSFEITDESTLALLRGGRRAASFDRFYQPGLELEIPFGTRPWARQAPFSEGGTLAEPAGLSCS